MSCFRLCRALMAGAVAAAMPPTRAPSCAADAPAPPAENLAAYEAIGHTVATDLHLQSLAWTDAQFEAFISGLRAGVRGQRLQLDPITQAQFETIGNRIANAQAQEKVTSSVTGSLAAYLEQACKQFKLQQAASGLLFRVVRFGSGPRPTADDMVVVSLEATSPDASGSIPALTADKVRIKVADLIPGLAEAVQMLSLDGSGLFLLPPTLSFRNGAWPKDVRPGTPLIFNLQLHDIEPADAAR